MSRAPAAARFPLAWLALPALLLLSPLSGCQSPPAAPVSLTSNSSLLAVDVLYPFPMSRDPTLVQAFFVRGPIDAGVAELPELIPASFVKRDRAYLLDPEPGVYSLVAVTSLVAPPWNDNPVAGGVTRTVWNGDIGHAVIFPAELIHRTRTTVGAGGVAFMGALRVQRSERINADAEFHDALQKRIAERIRPGVTSESGVPALFSMTWTVDLEATVFSRDRADRAAFFDAAQTDLGDSPWAGVVARAAPRGATTARSRTSAPRKRRAAPKPPTAAPKAPSPSSDPEATPLKPESVAAVPQSAVVPDAKVPTTEPEAALPQAAVPEPEAATAGPEAVAALPPTAVPEPEVAIPEPEPEPPPEPRRRFTGLPPGSPLAEIELGMRRHEVRKILGDPDDRADRRTAKAWIPFYSGPDAELVDWIYDGVGRVVFSLHDGSLEVLDVVDHRAEPR